MINCSENAAKQFNSSIPRKLIKQQECFMVMALNANNEPIKKPKMVSLGTVNMVNVHPRDVFRYAIECNAVSIILAHNHPSGEIQPSEEDKELTNKMKEIGKLLDIKIFDHLILSPNKNYYSFADNFYM